MSWNELLAIKAEAKKLRAEDRAKPIMDCPVCGATLDENAAGVMNCPLGHYQQRGKQRGSESV